MRLFIALMFVNVCSFDVSLQKYVYIYTLESNTLVEKTKLELTVNVMSVWALAYSPDGAWLATGDNDKKVNIFDSVKNSKVNYVKVNSS